MEEEDSPYKDGQGFPVTESVQKMFEKLLLKDACEYLCLKKIGLNDPKKNPLETF